MPERKLTETKNHLRLTLALFEADSVSVKSRLHDSFDAAGYLQFLERHELGALVHGLLEKMQYSPPALSAMRETLRARYWARWHKNEILLREQLQLRRALAERGARVLFLKGPLFAERYYGDAALRPTHDIDVLVREADLPEFEAWLATQGWGLRVSDRGFYRRLLHHYVYARAAGPQLELHWTLRNHLGCFSIDHSPIWASAVEYRCRDQTILLPAPESDLLLLTLSLFSDSLFGTANLKAYLDIAIVLRALGDTYHWQSYFNWLEEGRLDRIVATTIAHVLEVSALEHKFPCLQRELTKRSAGAKSFPSGTGLPLPETLHGLNGVARKAWWIARSFRCYRAPALTTLRWLAVVLVWDWGGVAVSLRRGARRIRQASERSISTISAVFFRRYS